MLKKMKKAAAVTLAATCMCCSPAQASGYVQAKNPVFNSPRYENGYLSFRLSIPVRVEQPHTQVRIEVSSDPDFMCDDQAVTLQTMSEQMIVPMGRWIAHKPCGENVLYCRMSYYEPGFGWSRWKTAEISYWSQNARYTRAFCLKATDWKKLKKIIWTHIQMFLYHTDSPAERQDRNSRYGQTAVSEGF